MSARASKPSESGHHGNDRMLVREVDGEVLILDTVADQIHQLNPTASLIWRMWDLGATPSDIEYELASQFDIDADVIRRDVEKAIERFRDLSLLRRQMS